MESISVFDIFKIGVGPSSSHTMGPWVAAKKVITLLEGRAVKKVKIKLFGSLSKTGRGHGTDIAVMLGLKGFNPKTIKVDTIDAEIQNIYDTKTLDFNQEQLISFDPAEDIEFNDEMLPFHPNALTFIVTLFDDSVIEETYYSVGGGFVVQEVSKVAMHYRKRLKYPINNEGDLLRWIETTGLSISEIVMENEKCWRQADSIEGELLKIWKTMQKCIFRGCNTKGTLPGGLNVKRRAYHINKNLLGGLKFKVAKNWKNAICISNPSFSNVTKWVSCFALAVNEENASFGRVVTAPTNGAAGVIPAVLMYYVCFCEHYKGRKDIIKFLLTAGEIGSLFKKGATISAAMGGCQAEIGVSSAMAAAGLTECLGGTPHQVLMAAEIAMEHHLGLTCDPIGGLVQVPCIERNTMGAMKAITASQIALTSDPTNAKVTLDGVIKTMWETALDMNHKYKETSDGGLATNVPVIVPEC